MTERMKGAATVLENADRNSGRLIRSLVASLAINVLLWSVVGATILKQKTAPPSPIEISRVVLTKEGKKQPKIVSRQQVQRRVARIRRRIVKKIEHERQQRERPHLPRSIRQPRPHTPPVSDALNAPLRLSPPANGAHHRVLTALHPTSNTNMAKPGGAADLGQPTDAQNHGDNKINPPAVTQPTPQLQPNSEPPSQPPTEPPASDPTPTLQPTPTPRPEPTATPRPTPTPEPTPTPRPNPTPLPTPTPRPKGPTRDAEATRTAQPSIPESLQNAEFKTSVRVKVEIDADGSASPSLRGSSGNSEIDERVLTALRRWKWKPALKDGEPVASTQYFRFNFEVR